jgi:hypothetical protein
MPAAKIMLIRHAEKPNGEAGVMPDGAQSLSGEFTRDCIASST